MDEHIGLTRGVAGQILAKANLPALLQQTDTDAGTAQRLHNILVQYPSLLHTPALQRNAFQCGEAVTRVMARWSQAEWDQLAAHGSDDQTPTGSESESGSVAGAAAPSLQAATAAPISHLYLVALLLQLLALRASFTPKQQTRVDEWAATLSQRLGGAVGMDVVRERLRMVRHRFVTHDPFRHLQLASFNVPGLQHGQLHPNKKQRRHGHSDPSGDADVDADANGDDKSSSHGARRTEGAGSAVPFSFLPRSACPSCGRVQPFYCTHCFAVIHPLAKGKVPRVDLPIQVDIILHPNVLLHKSTALQLLLLAHPLASVHTYPQLPAFDDAHTAVVFPSDRASTVQQIAQRLRNKTNEQQHERDCDLPNADQSQSTQQQQSRESSLSSPSPPSGCPLVSLGRVVFLEGTWGEAERMLAHPRLQSLAHLRLDWSEDQSEKETTTETEAPTDAPTADTESSAPASAGPSASPLPSCPLTCFWRYQRFGGAFLSSIEAVYHCITQIQTLGVRLQQQTQTPTQTDDDASIAAGSESATTATHHRYDNLLWLFAMSYERMRAHYRTQPALLPPAQGS